MSKSNKNITIDINKVEGKPTETFEVISDGKNIIGIIEKIDNKFQVTTKKNQYKKTLNTLDDAISEILTYFNLHEK